MKSSDIYIIHNPVAGTSDPDHVKKTLTGILDDRGISYQLYQTGPDDDIANLTREAVSQGYDWIWAAGGDGTVSAVANGLVGGQAVLGIIPIGSGNSLARELGVPLDVKAACQTLLEDSQPHKIDAIRIKDKYYFLTVSAGVAARTMKTTKRAQKRKLGRLAYLINGLRLMLSRAIWPFKVSVDGKTHRIRATEVIAANAGIIGYRILRWGQDILVDDGVINLCSVRVNSFQDLLTALQGAALDQQDQVEEIHCLSARKEIRIDSASRLPIQGDGDPIGTTPVRLEVVPEAVSVLAPPEQP
jgi:YegS/Rv2252/BmrU family lipid kinase